jgi:RHS repeat-associated protein
LYNPNALGEARQVGGYASALAYHPNGAIKSFSYGNGITHSMSQNMRSLPEWTEDVGVLKDRYSYDANGNVTGIADAQGATGNRTMDYDNLNRLVHVLSPSSWGDATYTYDALDNLTSTKLAGGATARNTIHTFDPVTNILKGIFNQASNGASFSYDYDYDAQGNIKRRGGQSYAFDQGNRMTSAVGKATYRYDGLGRRVSVVGTDGVNRVQVYGQDGQLLYVKASNSATPTKYVYLHKHVLAEVSGSQITYDHTDGLGSPVAQTNASGALLNRTRYEPYGATASGKATTIGFTGHVSDNDTGLVYMQQRYYDPAAGRFLSIDPVVTDANTGGSFNRYVYANNSPYRYVDPDGRFAFLLPLVPYLVDATVVVVGHYVLPGRQGREDTARALGNAILNHGNSDGVRESDREAGPDGKRGSTGGPGAGKRFPAESPGTKDAKEGVPCRYCGRETTNEPGKDNSRERDHIDPRGKGGNNSPENEGDSCRSCNRSKGGRSPDEWKPPERKD